MLYREGKAAVNCTQRLASSFCTSQPAVLPVRLHEGSCCLLAVERGHAVSQTLWLHSCSLPQQQCAAKGAVRFTEGLAFVLLLMNDASPTTAVVQGAENFAREFKQLRRSFRFNEYRSISEVNPPNNPIEKVTHVYTVGDCQHRTETVFPDSQCGGHWTAF